ncbi:hypothetical protein M407DRAFT_31654 [Tulasnella calospora MUT 4182]|uniref:Uncharacterized protein n=1 Tax=Tulasnella calospora MUT 4182 TaxID=1051891 RepID=A0A0C3LB10_9AGAM|nr:hypothetical protein M407DRAFT_31654 [Tulasnella calospora MUT 4182]
MPPPKDIGWFQMAGHGAQTNKWMYPEELKQLFLYDNNIHKTLFPPPIENQGRLQTLPPLNAIQSQLNPEHAEMTLGIRPDGTSCLLITSHQLEKIFDELRLPKETLYRIRDGGRPFPSSTFRSLSPISFPSNEALKRKMITFRATVNKKQKKRADGNDTSQANKAFAAETNPERKWATGQRRSGFELARILYLSMYNRLGPSQATMYLNGWEGQLAGVSTLTFNLWSPSRNSEDDVLLDIAWSDVKLQDGADDVVSETHSITHLRIEEYQFLSRKGDKWTEGKPKAQGKGNTKILPAKDCAPQVQAHFADILSNHAKDPTKPHLLLVYNAQHALQVLRSLEIDTTCMVVGLHDLLGPSKASAGGRYRDYSYPPSRASPDRYSESKDTLSRDFREHSPPRRRSSDYHYQPPRPRYKDEPREPRLFHTASPTPPPQRSSEPHRKPIHIVDVRELYGTVSQRDVVLAERSVDIPLREVCIRVGIQEVQEGWSAGLDAEYLYDVWQELAGGSAIDERRAQLAQTNSMPVVAQEEPDADEAPGLHGGPSAGGPGGRVRDPYAVFDDDDDY